METNITGTLNVLEASKRNNKCKVVYASTSGVVGCSLDPNYMPDDSSPYCVNIFKKWPYYYSKYLAEIKAIEYCNENDIPLVLMRPTMMWGPGDYLFRSTNFLLLYIDQHLPVVPSGGYSIVDVRDVASAFIKAMEVGKNNQTYLLASKNGNFQELVNLLETITNIPAPAFSPPAPIIKSYILAHDFYNRYFGEYNPSRDPVRAEMSSYYWPVNSDKAKHDLGFNPINPVDTIVDTLKWLDENREKYQDPHQAKL
eukprot:TRINITY_DN3402_c0_g1_i2.p1 TRINITY_DN3402_c0_g1~~TRINITY_DN3402_c0_g1_i2.p1  ORF type:complete len:255 (+),score=48.22 TRINITY_DN3402_c0_g1_i2:544-1308(+)